MTLISEWRPANDLTLEPNAFRAATELSKCLALTAGPGAGKTEMLAQRADFLLRTGTCRYPKRILAISFKVDASKNLKERVQKRCGYELASRFDSYTFHAFAKRIIDKFRPLLTGNDALDVGYTLGDQKVIGKQITFGELVPLAIKILKGSVVARNAIRQTYSDVFLDEFQDCTDLQYELIKIVFQGTSTRLTAVGDTKQKIMGWAGALEGIFQTFADDFKALPLNMYRNFRSKPRLLRMQNEIIKTLDPASVMPNEQVVGSEGELYAWHFEDSRKEAEYLADCIETWIKRDQVQLSEIAILVSKQLDLYTDHLMQEFENRKIPYRNEQQLQDITFEPASRFIVDYLSSLYGRREPKAWLRIMDLIFPFDDDGIQSKIRINFQKLIKSHKTNIAQSELLGDPVSSWWDFAIEFLKMIGIETLVALSPEYETRQRLNDVIKETKIRINELLKKEPDISKVLQRFSDDQNVRILTIHKSKGLEFDSVIILGVENQTFWGKPDEERCAFFVGVSRAKSRLILTSCDFREIPPTKPNRWQENRETHAEFIGYASNHLTE